MIALRVTGVAEIDKVLVGLPPQLNDKMLKEAHARAAKPLVDRAHYNAPVYRTGNLAESIGVVRTRSELNPSGAVDAGVINVGPRRKGKYKGFAGHLVEYGKTNRGGGMSKKKPFMEQAWSQTQGQVQENISGEIGRVVHNFMKRTIKNSGR